MTEYLKQAEQIATAHGFALQDLGGGNMAFEKTAEDGSYWLATPTDREAEISETNPDADEWIIGRYLDANDSEASIIIEEPLSLDVVLSEHGRIPSPQFDNDGDGIEENLKTWADIRWRGRTGKPSWDKFTKILREDPALDAVFEAGFDVTSTGGGCTAFELVDEETETVFLMGAESQVTRHPLAKDWIVQRENKDGVLIGVDGLTLAEALARFRDIPVPTQGQENPQWYLSGWDEFDTNVAAAASAKP